MKPTSLLFSCLFLVSALISMAEAQSSVPRDGPQELPLDSLLSVGDVERARMMLESDSVFQQTASALGARLDRDSVKASYSRLFTELGAGVADSVEKMKEITQIVNGREDWFKIPDVGNAAGRAFEQLKLCCTTGDIAGAYKYFAIANFLRRRHILQEQKRLRDNADRVDLLLHHSRERLEVIKQSRDLDGGFSPLDEVAQLCRTFREENRGTPAYKGIGRELEERYAEFETRLATLQDERVDEERAEFKVVSFALGLDVGGIYSMNEAFPPFTMTYIYGFDMQRNPLYRSVPLGNDGNTVKGYQAFFGYVFGGSASYYPLDYINVELHYSYARINRQRPDFHMYGYGLGIPGYSSPISYSTVAGVVNYLLRIKTGLRVFSGVGISFSQTNAPVSYTYSGNTQWDDVYTSPSSKSTEIRALLRTGLEFIPSNSSIFSYSLIVDGSLRLTSSSASSDFIVRPYFRISYLL